MINVPVIYNKNFQNLDAGVRILLTLFACTQQDNVIELSKSKISVGVGTSRQTVGNHIKRFAETGALKYKFSGKGMINPDFYYHGPEELRAQVKERYDRFKSDV